MAMTIKEKLARLKLELEQMSLKHAAEMAADNLAKSPRRLEAERRRARMLARRISQLIKILGSSKPEG